MQLCNHFGYGSLYFCMLQLSDRARSASLTLCCRPSQAPHFLPPQLVGPRQQQGSSGRGRGRGRNTGAGVNRGHAGGGRQKQQQQPQWAE